MKTTIHHINQSDIIEIYADALLIKETQDALDIIGECMGQKADNVILYERNITPGFFNLKTRMAGEILQKFSTYRIRLIIIGDFAKYHSQSLHDFIYESNLHGQINFVDSLEEALKKFSS